MTIIKHISAPNNTPTASVFIERTAHMAGVLRERTAHTSGMFRERGQHTRQVCSEIGQHPLTRGYPSVENVSP